MKFIPNLGVFVKKRISKRLLEEVSHLLTFSLSGATLVASIYWLYTAEDKSEPVITTIGIVAAIWGLLINPWLEKRQARSEVIEALEEEIANNNAILVALMSTSGQNFEDGSIVYPRLVYSALDRALTSGLFGGEKDRVLRSVMQQSRITFECQNVLAAASETALLLANIEFKQINHLRFINSNFITNTRNCQASLVAALSILR